MVLLMCAIMASATVRDYVIKGHLFQNGKDRTLTIDGKVDVFDLFLPYCETLAKPEDCDDVIDDLHVRVHGRCDYAPHGLTRTAEDLDTCRDDIILTLASRYNYGSYLEIGCASDEVFEQVSEVVAVAVGVDPVRGGTLRMTSDEFFAKNGLEFDLIFIDGNHTAAQAMVDVQNALQVLMDGGSIVLHDCNPHLEKRQHYNLGSYNGDVWKVVGYLRTFEDIEIVTVDVDHGVAVVRRRPNLHPLPTPLLEQLLRSEDPLEAFTYAELIQHRESLLRLVSVAEFRAWLNEEQQEHILNTSGKADL
jgi:hypothetical protein